MKKIRISRFESMLMRGFAPYAMPVFADDEGNEFIIDGITDIDTNASMEGITRCKFGVLVIPDLENRTHNQKQ